MSYLVLARKYRPQKFEDLLGQEHVARTLTNAITMGRVHHAFLFTGARGIGKTSAARILAKALNCSDLRDGEPCDACPSCVAIREGRALDVAEFDAASNNTVGDMRELLPRVFTAPSDLRRKVFIIDEVQRISQGWDVLLKTLEEPPDHVVKGVRQLAEFVAAVVIEPRGKIIGRGNLLRMISHAGQRIEHDAAEQHQQRQQHDAQQRIPEHLHAVLEEANVLVVIGLE